MKKDTKHYKFVNSETDHVIFFLSLPQTEKNHKLLLEDTRCKLAYEKAIYIGNIYYAASEESDFDD